MGFNLSQLFMVVQALFFLFYLFYYVTNLSKQSENINIIFELTFLAVSCI